MGTFTLAQTPALELTLADGTYYDTTTAAELKEKLTVQYIDTNGTKTQKSDFTVTLPDSATTLTVGDNNVTVTAGDISSTVKVTAVQDTVSSIAVTGPTKMSYVSGEKLNLAGLTVTATCASGKTKNITSYQTKVGETTVSSDTELTVAGFNGKTITVAAEGKTATTSELTVSAKSVAIPAETGSYIYNAQEQTFAVENDADAAYYEITGDMKGTNAETYQATVTLKDKTETKWSDNSTEDKALKWVIEPKTVDDPVIAVEPASYGYSGGAITPTTVTVKDGDVVIATSEYDVAYSNNTNAGSATVTVTDKEGGNYTVSGSTTFEINPKAVTASIDPIADQEYTGSAIEPTVTVKDGSVVIDASEYIVAYSNNTNVGTATITVSDVTGGNYTVSGSETFGITAHDISGKTAYVTGTASQNIVTGIGSFTEPTFRDTRTTANAAIPGEVKYCDGETYEDASAKTFEDIKSALAVLEKDATGTISWKFTPTAAGNYSGTLTGTLTYTMVDIEFKVGSAAATSENTFPNAKAKPVYGDSWGTILGTQAALTAKVDTATDSTAASFNIKIDGSDYQASAVPTAGDHVVTVVYSGTLGGKEYADVAAVTKNVSVEKAPLTVTADAKTATYGDAAPTYTAVYGGFVNGETVAVLGGTLAFDCSYAKNSDVGTYDIAPKGLTSDNYEISFVAGTLTVTAKPLTDAMVTLGENPNYTGEEQTITVTVADSAAAITESDYTVTGNKATTVGSYTVTVNGKGNYSGTVTKSWEMLKAKQSALSFASGIANKTYGDAAFEVVVAGGSGTGAFSVTSSDSAVLSVAQKDATTFTVTVKGAGKAKLTVSKAEDDNYEAATPVESAEITVAQKEVKLAWTGYENLVYDGKAKNVTATATDLIGGDECTVTVTGGTEKNAGSYTATAEALSNANYSLPGTKTQAYTIAPKTLTKDDLEYKSGATTKVYDGTTAAADIVVGVKSGVLASGDTLEIAGAAAYDSKDITATKIVFTPTAITEGNYCLAETETVEIEATITAKELTITGVKAEDRSYKEGNATVELTGGELDGVAKGETVTFTLGTGTIADAAVGARKAVTTAITLTGADAANYTLKQPEGVTVNIMAAQTIAVNAETGKDRTQVDTPEDVTQDVADTAKAVYNISVDTQAVAIMQEASNEAVSDEDKVNEIIESAKNDEKIKALIENNDDIKEEDIKIAAVPFIAIEVKSAELTEENKEIKLEIDFKLQIKATVGDLSNPKETVNIGEPETMTVNKPITLDIPLPAGFAADGNAFIKHIHNGKTYIYMGTVSGNKLTFTSLFGLSEFTIDPDLEPVAKIERDALGDAIYFETLQDAVNEDGVQDGETIKLMKNAEAATVSRPISFTVDANGYTYSIAIGNGYSRVEPEGDTYTITKNAPIPSGGGGSASYTVTVNAAENGTVAANRKSASTGSTVTLTVTPDEGYALDQLTVLDKNGKELDVTDLGDGKFSFQMPNGKVSVSATFKAVEAEEPEALCPRDASCPIEPFTDTKNDFWWHDGIHYCVENGLMQGVGDGLFDPNGTLSRAQIVTILWRMENEPVANYAMSFKDVNDGKWYTEAIRWAQSTGIVLGYSDEAFGTNDPVTREQLATILYRYALLKEIDVDQLSADTNTLSYMDVFTVSEWAAPGMHFCIAVGVVQGDDNGMLNPTDTATRAQAAAMVQRFCENVLEK